MRYKFVAEKCSKSANEIGIKRNNLAFSFANSTSYGLNLKKLILTFIFNHVTENILKKGVK